MSDEIIALSSLAADINKEHEAILESVSRGLQHAQRCGQLLIQAKAQLQHGEFGDWIKANCQFSDRTARAYMRIADRLPTLEAGKWQRVAEMPLREALAAIADERTTELDRQVIDPTDDAKRILEEGRELLRKIYNFSDFIHAIDDRLNAMDECVSHWNNCTAFERGIIRERIPTIYDDIKGFRYWRTRRALYQSRILQGVMEEIL